MTHTRVISASLLWLLIVSGCVGTPSLEVSQQFQDIEEAFAQSKSPDEFAQVGVRYQQLIDHGLQSGAVFYNQGNAWMRAEKPGRAIASYRQAQRFRPADPYLKANLEFAIATANAGGLAVPETGIAGYVFFWQNWLSYPAKFVMTTVLLAITLICVVFQQLSWLPTVSRPAAWISGLLCLVAVASTAWDWNRFDRTTHGVIDSAEVIARKGNSESYEPAFTQSLSEGTEFIVMERRADWLQIQVQDDSVAWIPADTAVLF